MSECSHDWRLESSHPRMVNQLHEPETWNGFPCQPGEKHFYLFPWQEGTYERWYCTRCRAVEWAVRINGEIVATNTNEIKTDGWVQPYQTGNIEIVWTLA